MKKVVLVAIVASLSAMGCKDSPKGIAAAKVVAPIDSQSYAQLDKSKITHLQWDVFVDFDKKVIVGNAAYDFENKQADRIFFDTDYLIIDSVAVQGKITPHWTLHPRDHIKGSALEIEVTPLDNQVTIYYKTTPQATALQWLSPGQTHDNKHPFLLSQGQAILTRSYIPIQDSPSVRLTYNAKVEVPKDLMALMSATNPKQKSPDGKYYFEMEQQIPAYLISLAVGDVAYKAIDQRTGVYAEPGVLEKAAWELAQMGEMVEVAEKLYGPYPWKVYDVLVLPPSFPFGGMENPRLTFATPTILVGDRSLTNLVAHELAHSWSGNLVTNASWDDFWLNEGFTVYFERRIMEAMQGKDYADMISVIGYQDLQTSMELIDEHFTSLYVDLQGKNPDDAFSDVPYDKGYLFLKMLEQRYTREKLDAFLNKYFSDHAFQTMTTQDFIAYLKQHLTQGQDDFVQDWIYNTGWPKDLVVPTSRLFDQVEQTFELHKQALSENRVLENPGYQWSTNEYVHYIRGIDPTKMSSDDLAKIDQLFDFTHSSNAEIQCAWYEKGFLCLYEPVNEPAKTFLTHVGRRKFLEPLYLALIESNQKEFALSIYQNAKENYHFVARQTIEQILEK